ncbi:MAG: BlaI/MecI/CopY family transcriptional regulator [Flavobacterium sp.]|uniref:Transcriptional regulator n=1 Tax=Pukyongia salina TaxID=2094025 RepID=A0A2S0HXF8_9FLAO|nr:BlaI/MecI/CopY family transcriptional regulator [Pukyongia salina]AVI51349.1 transcriptional regulator [Pukyongia salina]KAA3625597.1 MAG: BlaI/MecI/CopY family transcriptional regulator [Flavobacterium sp.]
MERLTNKEEEVMQALWKLEKGFVKDILAQLPEKQHYNTISTIVRNLEEKGYVAYNAYGKTHQYYPLVSKEEYTKRFMNLAMKRYFNNNYKSMVSFFAKEEKISAEELREILEIIENKK